MSGRRAAAPPAAAPAATAFRGFADGRRSFFVDLARHQDRAWFAAHRGAYETGWRQPMEALLGALHGRLQAQHRGLLLDPPHIMRPFRDIRFSHDKRPLKEQVAGMIEVAGSGTDGRMRKVAALYAHVGLEVVFAAGRYVMEGAVLQRFRDDLLTPRRAAGVVRLLAGLRRRGFTLAAADSLKTAPRGVPRDHPHVALLRLRGLVVRFPPLSPARLTQARLVADLSAAARHTAPLVDYLAALSQRA